MTCAMMNGIFVAFPVWGDGHIDRLMRYGLPCLLAPRNIPALVKRHKVEVLLYTNGQDAETLRAHPTFKDVEAVCPVRVIEVGCDRQMMVHELHPGHGHGGTMMKQCHNRAIHEAWHAGYGLCPTVADEVFSDGWGDRILECVDSGKRALMEAGYNITHLLLPALDARRSGGAIAVSAPEMSRLLLDLTGVPPEPSHDDTRWSLSWGVPPARGFLVRPHHIPVDFIFPSRGPASCARGQDNDLAHQALDSWDQVMLTQSTSVLLTGGVDGLGDSAPPKSDEWNAAVAQCVNPELQAIWLKRACNEWHTRWMHTNFWCDDGTLTEDEKRPVERHADEVVAECMRQLDLLRQGQGRPEMLRTEALLSQWW